MNFDNLFRSNYGTPNKAGLDRAIQAMKDAGASQVDCVKVLMTELKISLREADALILNSAAWSEQKRVTEELRDRIDQILRRLFNEGDKPV